MQEYQTRVFRNISFILMNYCKLPSINEKKILKEYKKRIKKATKFHKFANLVLLPVSPTICSPPPLIGSIDGSGYRL